MSSDQAWREASLWYIRHLKFIVRAFGQMRNTMRCHFRLIFCFDFHLCLVSSSITWKSEMGDTMMMMREQKKKEEKYARITRIFIILKPSFKHTHKLYRLAGYFDIFFSFISLSATLWKPNEQVVTASSRKKSERPANFQNLLSFYLI